METRPPVIVSQDRFKDLEPYIGYIYNQDQVKWRDVFPWEFPQHASKEAEEAFIDHLFTPQEAHVQGYRFLKQVFYCISIWNAEIKMPMIAQLWIDQNQALLVDPNTREYIYHRDAQAKTFFNREDFELYGEKMLEHVVIYLQHTLNASNEPPTTAASKDTTGAQIADPVTLHNGTQHAKHPANIQVFPPGRQQIVASTAHVKSLGNTKQCTQVESVSTFNSPPPHSCKRENSHTQSSNSRNVTIRYDPQQGVFTNPTTQRLPQPSRSMVHGPIPERPVFQTQLPMPSVLSAACPQSMLNDTHRPHGAFMPPMPAAQQYLDMQQCDVPQSRHIARGRFHQQSPRDFVPGAGQPSFDRETISNRSNRPIDRPGARLEGTEQSQGTRQRRDSSNSRGGKGRGQASYIRGKSSRGRNSFSHRYPSNNLAGAVGRHLRPTDHRSGSPDCHGDLTNRPYGDSADRNWRSASDRYEPSFNENNTPRVFSGPEPHTQAGNMQSRPPAMQLLQPPSVGRIVYARPPDIVVGSDMGIFSAYVAPSNEKPILHSSMLDHDAPDPAKAPQPEKVLTRSHVGLECSHVRKLIVFGIDRKVDGSQVLAFFRQFGANVKVSRAGNLGSYPDLFWVYYDNHISVIEALRFRGHHGLGDHFKIEVPREYWQPDHKGYPGEGHPAARPRGDRPAGAIFSRDRPETLIRPLKLTSPEGVRSHGKLKHNSSLDQVMSDGLPSEATTTTATPTTSATNTPNKKDKRKAKAKHLRGNGVQQRATEQMVQSDDGILAVSSGDTVGIKGQAKLSAESTAVAVAAVSTRENESEPEDVAMTLASQDHSEQDQAATGGSEVAGLRPFPAPEKDEKEAAGSSSPAVTEAQVGNEGEAIAESAVISEAVRPSQLGQSRQYLLPKTDEEQADDSFHTASGTPEDRTPLKRALQRGTDESLSTVVIATLAPEAEVEVHVGKPDADKKAILPTKVPNDEPNVPVSLGQPALLNTPAEDVIQPSPTASSCSGTSRLSRKAATVALPKVKIPEQSSRRTSDTEKQCRSVSHASILFAPALDTAPTTPAAPSLGNLAPASTHDGASLKMQSNTGLLVKNDESSAVPKFASTVAGDVTSLSQHDACSTAEDDEEIRDESQYHTQLRDESKKFETGANASRQISTVAGLTNDAASELATKQQTKKPEKAKGPAQTESLLGGLFSKTQKQKSKKPKAQKAKGSMKSKSKFDGEQAVDAGMECENNVGNGTSPPLITTKDGAKTVAAKVSASNTINEYASAHSQAIFQPTYDAQQPPSASSDKVAAPTSSRDASPSKSMRFFHSIAGILYPNQPLQAPKPKSIKEPFRSQPHSSITQPLPTNVVAPGIVRSDPDPSAALPSSIPLSKSTGAKVPADESSFRDFTDGKSGKQMDKAGTASSKTYSPNPETPVVDSACVLPGENESHQFSRLDSETVIDFACGVDGDDCGRLKSGIGLGISNTTADSMDIGVTESNKAAKKKKKSGKKRKNKGGSAQVEGNLECHGMAMASPDRSTERHGHPQPHSGATEHSASLAHGVETTICAEASMSMFSREQTPASSTAVSVDSPSRLERMQRQGENHLLSAPSRPRGHHKSKRGGSARADGKNKADEMVLISQTEDTDDSEYGEQGIASDKADRVIPTLHKRSMTAKPPVVYFVIPSTATDNSEAKSAVEKAGESGQSPANLDDVDARKLGGLLEAKADEPDELRTDSAHTSS